MLRAEDFEDFAARDLVAVNSGAGADWATASALVVTAHPDELHLALRGQPDNPAALEPGRIVRIVRGRQLTARGQIIALERGTAPVLVVRSLPPDHAGQNQRAYHRIPTMLAEMTASAMTGGRAVGFRARVVDLSGGGAQITCPRQLDQGDTVHLRLTLPETGDIVEVPGRVAWARQVRSQWRAGIRFEGVTPVTQDKIVRAVLRSELALRRIA
jgi:Tfp pilus assembly protein PilZ